jgi:hypothetical protein
LENDLTQSEAIDFVFQVERHYANLMRLAGSSANEEPNLGGKLLYVGGLDTLRRAVVVAGNVAGAATLTATADVPTQKQAIRDGIVDFLVTSLDEALRILKNEVRKRERVAVCVGIAPEAVEREMAERGVLPDLLRPSNARREVPCGLIWTADTAPAQWLPKLDAVALDCLGPGQRIERRWLRFAPRYLGRMARVHGLTADREFASHFIARVRNLVESGEFRVAVTIEVVGDHGTERHRFKP